MQLLNCNTLSLSAVYGEKRSVACPGPFHRQQRGTRYQLDMGLCGPQPPVPVAKRISGPVTNQNEDPLPSP